MARRHTTRRRGLLGFIPDWLIYGLFLFIILANTIGRSSYREAPLPPPHLGPALPNALPTDPAVIVEVSAPSSGVGTAFAIDENGTWLTARHVVDSCDEIGLRINSGRFVKANTPKISQSSDVAIIESGWSRPALVRDQTDSRQTGEHGFFLGFPQGKPGEAAGALLGRQRLLVRGRYKTSEPILTWAEIGRTRGLSGSLGGLSGGPALDKDGEVVGIVTAESPRRGRIYTVAPETLNTLPLRPSGRAPEPISSENYGQRADQYRRSRQITQLACLVD